MKKFTISTAAALLLLLTGCSYAGPILSAATVGTDAFISYKQTKHIQNEEKEKLRRQDSIAKARKIGVPGGEYVSAPDSISVEF